MEIKLLLKDELKHLNKLCISGENWADVYYKKLDTFYTGVVKTYAVVSDGNYIAEITAYEDSLKKYESLAVNGETVQVLDHKVAADTRGRKLGTQLLKYVLKLYKNRGYKYALVKLFKDSDVDLSSYYKRCGFTTVFEETDASVVLSMEL